MTPAHTEYSKQVGEIRVLGLDPKPYIVSLHLHTLLLWLQVTAANLISLCIQD